MNASRIKLKENDSKSFQARAKVKLTISSNRLQTECSFGVGHVRTREDIETMNSSSRKTRERRSKQLFALSTLCAVLWGRA
jgi:hypothetical protein